MNKEKEEVERRVMILSKVEKLKVKGLKLERNKENDEIKVLVQQKK